MLRIDTNDFVPPWKPTGSTAQHHLRPPVGTIIALARRPWRVVDHVEIDPDHWTDVETDRYRTHYSDRHPPHEWPLRPWTLVLDLLPTHQRHQTRISGDRSTRWDVLGEHYPVCVHCQELHPCHHMSTEAAVQRAQGRLDALTSIGQGQCWWCGEPITPRQKRVSFEGPNLLLPGGSTPVEFHARNTCKPGVRSYRNRMDPPPRPAP